MQTLVVIDADSCQRSFTSFSGFALTLNVAVLFIWNLSWTDSPSPLSPGPVLDNQWRSSDDLNQQPRLQAQLLNLNFSNIQCTLVFLCLCLKVLTTTEFKFCFVLKIFCHHFALLIMNLMCLCCWNLSDSKKLITLWQLFLVLFWQIHPNCTEAAASLLWHMQPKWWIQIGYLHCSLDRSALTLLALCLAYFFKVTIVLNQLDDNCGYILQFWTLNDSCKQVSLINPIFLVPWYFKPVQTAADLAKQAVIWQLFCCNLRLMGSRMVQAKVSQRFCTILHPIFIQYNKSGHGLVCIKQLVR